MNRRARARLVQCALAAALVLAPVRAAFPHAEVLRTTPVPGATLAIFPSRIHIWFSERVEAPSVNAIEVFAPDGRRVNPGQSSVSPDDGTDLTTPIGAAGTGTFSVRWRVISADGHPVDGTFRFSVGTVSATADATNAPNQPMFIGLQAGGRWLHLLAFSLVAGPLALMLVGAGQLPRFHTALWRVSRAGTLLLLPVAGVMLIAQAAAVSGSLSDGVRVESLQRLLTTNWGGLWRIRTGLEVALALAIWWGARRRHGPRDPSVAVAIAIGAGLIVATSLNGHAAATSPVWLSVGVDWVHTAATGIWVGGLLTLAIVAWGMEHTPDEEHRALTLILPRFSTLAMVCVQALVLTGLYHTWAHVSGPAALTSTPYGITLLVKLALVAVILIPAAVNLLIITPKITAMQRGPRNHAGERSTFGLFRSMVSVEAVLAVCVLGTVGALTSMAPAAAASDREEAANAPSRTSDENPPALVLVDRAGSAVITLSLGSAEIGSNRATIALQGGDASAQVRLRVEPPAQSGMAPSTVTPEKAGNQYRATLVLAPAGSWVIDVLIATASGTDMAAFHVDLPLRGAGELVAAAEERMNALRSAIEDVEVLEDGTATQKRIEYQAPDRRRSTGDVPEVAVGAQLYMRHGTQWHVQTAEPFTWPRFTFLERASELTVVGREKLDGAECFVISFVDNMDGSRNRLWIATTTFRVMQHSSSAPGRFTVSRFSRFDAGPQITTPS